MLKYAHTTFDWERLLVGTLLILGLVSKITARFGSGLEKRHGKRRRITSLIPPFYRAQLFLQNESHGGNVQLVP